MYSNLQQFGLYRYQNSASRHVLKEHRNFHSKFILCSVLTMSLVFCCMLYVLLNSQSQEPSQVIKNSEVKPKLPERDLEGGIEVIEISGKNGSDGNKIKRLDSDESDRSPDSQRLVFFPSRTLKPPRTQEKPKIVHLPSIPSNHRVSSRMAEPRPRPFKHMIPNSIKPHGFKVQSTARSFNQPLNNIHDIINHNQPGFPDVRNQFGGSQFNGNKFVENQNYFPENSNHFQGVKHQKHQNQMHLNQVHLNQMHQNQVHQNQMHQNQMHPNQHPNFVPNYHNPQLTNLHQIPGQPAQFSVNQNQYPFQQKKKRQKNPQQHFDGIESSSVLPIQLAGTYRHPRKEKDFTKMVQSEQSHFANQPSMQPDPFHNYKPNSAFEINQMVTGEMKQQSQNQNNPHYFRRKFKQQVASIPNYKIDSKDVTGIYQNVLKSGKKFQDRNEMEKAKPIQLMLDVYPANQDMEVQQQVPSIIHQLPGMMQMANQMMIQPNQMIQQLPRVPRLKPFQGYYQDPAYFNSMAFPQLMPRYPAYYRYPKLQAQSSNVNPMSVTKPSQLVVHLNLFPKDKTSFKRSSTEEEMEKKKIEPMITAVNSTAASTTGLPFNINFNVNTGNGHPENIHHHVNLPKDPYFNKDLQQEAPYRPSYYYDENDELDQSIQVAPSLIYHNIHRDRPIHLMLQNSTTTEAPVKTINNHKYTYQNIERPKKHMKIKNEPRNFYD